MKKFKIKDRVIHDYLGKATVIKVIKSCMDSRCIVAYLIRTDETPDVRYNMGEKDCLAFPNKLKEDLGKSE